MRMSWRLQATTSRRVRADSSRFTPICPTLAVETLFVDSGKLRIAEVTSRFTDIESFIELIKEQGYNLQSKDTSNTHFAMFDFVKVPQKSVTTASAPSNAKKGKGKKAATENQPEALLERSAKLLKPCLYKKR